MRERYHRRAASRFAYVFRSGLIRPKLAQKRQLLPKIKRKEKIRCTEDLILKIRFKISLDIVFVKPNRLFAQFSNYCSTNLNM